MENIYDFIKAQRVKYEKPIVLEEGYDWNMKDHLRTSYLYKNSQFSQDNEDRYLRPNKNIVLSVLNVQYRTEGFDVKDINLYINDADEYYKSHIVNKYHDDKWALENQVDTLIDDIVESYCDYGGALVRKIKSGQAQVVDLRTIEFCNQTDLLAYPFGIKHELSEAQLREMETEGWGKDENGATIDVESLVTLVKKEESDMIEVTEIHGIMPTVWLTDNETNQETEKYEQQIQIVAFYTDNEGNEHGVTLFRKREPQLPFKLLKRDDIKRRALGRGGVEELFEAQEWTNWNETKATEMLEAASKIIHVTDDPSFSQKHPAGLQGLENNEVVDIGNGARIETLNNTPRNLVVFNDAINRWNEHAQRLGSAVGPLAGETPSAGTPFKLFEAQQIEARDMHRYRQGKIAVFMDEIYRDWYLPAIQKAITAEDTFLAEFSADEMQEISESVVTHQVNQEIVDNVLSGKPMSNEEVAQRKESIRAKFFASGAKQFIDIVKEEFKKPLAVKTNIAGKQKNLALLTDKIVNVLRQYIATPEIRQDKEMAKLLNTILESSGLSPIMFNPTPAQVAPQALPQQAGGTTQPLQALSQAQQQPELAGTQ